MPTDKDRWICDAAEVMAQKLTTAEQILALGKLYDEAHMDGRIAQGDLHLMRWAQGSDWNDDAQVDQAREVRQESFLSPIDVDPS